MMMPNSNPTHPARVKKARNASVQRKNYPAPEKKLTQT
jgi:hypothetical protein